MSPHPSETSKSLIVTHSYDSTELARPLAELRRDLDAAKAVAGKALSDRTLREYANDWRRFTEWCASRRLDPLAVDVAMGMAYLGHLKSEGIAPKSIARFFTGMKVGVRKALQAAGREPGIWSLGEHPAPFREFFQGLNKERKPERKRAMTADRLAELPIEGRGLRAVRDRALLLMGFAGAFRRSELVAIRREHVEKTPDGLRILIPKSKTDQQGEGAYVAIHPGDGDTCPVKALGLWIRAARLAGTPIDEGYVFRPVLNGKALDRKLNERAVAKAVKRAAEALGLDAATFSGHSLRSGFVTSAAKAGMPAEKIMGQTRHKKVDQLLEYIRFENVFEDHAGRGLLADAAKRARAKRGG